MSLLAIASAGFGVGCVEKGLYVQALSDLDFSRGQARDLTAKLKASQDQIAQLQKEASERDAKLNELNASSADLARKLDELTVLNTAIAGRLEKAGQGINALGAEKGALAESLADTRRQLEELKKQQAAADARAADFQSLVKKFEALTSAGKLKIALRDGRMIIELPNDVLFDSAKSDLKSEGKATLVEVAKVLKGVNSRHFQVAGHTDAVKISTARFPSNWELSTARAVTVTRLLQDEGVSAQELSAAGYGEFDPVSPNDTPEGRAKNRRIEITLVPNLEEFVKVAGPKPAAAAAPAAAPATPPPPAAPPPSHR